MLRTRNRTLRVDNIYAPVRYLNTDSANRIIEIRMGECIKHNDAAGLTRVFSVRVAIRVVVRFDDRDDTRVRLFYDDDKEPS